MKPHLDYQAIHKKAKKLVEESVHFLGESYRATGAVVGKTMEVTKLHYKNRKDHLTLYRTLHDLGQVVAEEMRHQKGEEFYVTPAIQGLFGRILELEKEIAELESKMGSATIVNKQPKTKKPPRKQTDNDAKI